MYVNGQGFLNNKIKIVDLIQKWTPEIVCISETHVTPDVQQGEIDISGYISVNCTSDNKRTGGVLIFLKSGSVFSVRYNSNKDSYLWFICIELKLHREKMLLTALYHPPGRKVPEFLDFLDGFFEDVSSFKGDIICLGDFNIDLKKKSFYSEKCKSIIVQNGLTQIVDDYTRITENSSTLIDYVITNCKNLECKVHLTPKISDHSIVSLNLKAVDEYCFEFNSIVRSYKNYRSVEFQDALRETVWDNFSNDVNILAHNFIDPIKRIFDIMCPTKKIIKKNNHVVHWMNDEIRQLMKQRDDQYKRAVWMGSSVQWELYKKLRNNVVKKLRLEEKKYYHQIIRDSSNNDLWKNLKELFGNKRKSKISNVKFNNKLFYDAHEIAEKFNTFFVRSIEDVIENVTIRHDDEFYLSKIVECPRFSKFTKVSMQQIRNYVRKLKNTCGPEDGITTEVFKDIFDVIGNRLFDVVNNSLEYGSFPDIWKVSVVVPIPKISGTILCEEFRGVHTVPIYEKVLEMIVRDQLLNFLNENKVLIDCQSGFRAKHSCESSVLYMCNDWLREIDRNRIILAVFIDFKRAFETVDRKLLLKKLERMGIRDLVLDWFKSYLSKRTQKVKFNGVISSGIENEYGVPQGTTLGNLLFLIYINDIIKNKKHCKILAFADDTMLYITGENSDHMVNIMNEDLEIINDWMGDNRLIVNSNKSQYMFFGSEIRLKEINKENIKVSINKNILKEATSIKYLGVKMDQNLNFKLHVEYIAGKMAQKIQFINRISDKIDIKTRSLLFRAIVLPHLDFCASLFFNLKSNSIDKLQKILNRGMRMVLRCNRRTPIRLMLEALNLMNVRQRIKFRTLEMIYKIEHKMLPNYLSENIKYISEVHEYNTRNRNNFYVDSFRTCSASGSTLVKGLTLYNELPNEIKNCDNYRNFRKLLISYIKEHYD